MSTIQVSCVDQTLVLTNTPLIASGGIEEDYVSFSFCPLWQDYFKTAVFWRSEAEAYHVVLDASNSCMIPVEVLQEDGAIFFGVFGVNEDGVQRTSEVLRYTIVKGVITQDTQPSDPTPDIYTQLLQACAEALAGNAGKANRPQSAKAGNLASLTATGDLADSGRAPGAAGGVATLDSGGKVPAGQLPSMDYIPLSEKAAANGVATLGSNGKVPSSQLPSLDYIPTKEKGAAGGVASLGEDGKVLAEQLPDTMAFSTSAQTTLNEAQGAAAQLLYYVHQYGKMVVLDFQVAITTHDRQLYHFYVPLPQNATEAAYDCMSVAVGGANSGHGRFVGPTNRTDGTVYLFLTLYKDVTPTDNKAHYFFGQKIYFTN